MKNYNGAFNLNLISELVPLQRGTFYKCSSSSSSTATIKVGQCKLDPGLKRMHAVFKNSTS